MEERKGRRVLKCGKDLGEGKNADLDRITRRGRKLLERDTIAAVVVVVPSFTDTRCVEPPNRDQVVLSKLMFVKLEVDGKPETVPLELLRTALIIDKSTDRITYSPQPVEWEREGSKGVDVFAEEK